MILLDTNAVIWLDQGHPRARTLARSSSRLLVSPATLLELHQVRRIIEPSGIDRPFDPFLNTSDTMMMIAADSSENIE